MHKIFRMGHCKFFLKMQIYSYENCIGVVRKCTECTMIVETFSVGKHT